MDENLTNNGEININSSTIPEISKKRAKELWRKAAIKTLTLVRMKNFNKYINNVYYGIGVEEEVYEEENEGKSFMV